MYLVLPVLNGWASNASLGLNILGAVILIGALIPPFLDTKKSKKTFAIAEKFFLFYTCGSFFMLVNAITNIPSNTSNTAFLAMFIVFTISNTISVTLNGYMWMVKRRNVKNAAAANMTEQEYWEQVLSKEALQ